MHRNLISILVVIMALVAASAAGAEEFSVKDYEFVWKVAKVGGVSLALTKNPEGPALVMTGFGGGLATVALSPPDAEAVGKMLLKAGDYYDGHQKYYNDSKDSNKGRYRKEYSETVAAGGHQVIFFSTPRGAKFIVKVGKAKTFASMVQMSKDDALKIGGWLVKAEEMTAYINSKIKL
ncbi:MAG: hypothetical protein GY859_39025 [Desulfobacterales bacterium]|nr:hypothetical protein [Desulfobacterales bacterium]